MGFLGGAAATTGFGLIAGTSNDDPTAQGFAAAAAAGAGMYTVYKGGKAVQDFIAPTNNGLFTENGAVPAESSGLLDAGAARAAAGQRQPHQWAKDPGELNDKELPELPSEKPLPGLPTAVRPPGVSDLNWQRYQDYTASEALHDKDPAAYAAERDGALYNPATGRLQKPELSNMTPISEKQEIEKYLPLQKGPEALKPALAENPYEHIQAHSATIETMPEEDEHQSEIAHSESAESVKSAFAKGKMREMTPSEADFAQQHFKEDPAGLKEFGKATPDQRKDMMHEFQAKNEQDHRAGQAYDKETLSAKPEDALPKYSAGGEDFLEKAAKFIRF